MLESTLLAVSLNMSEHFVEFPTFIIPSYRLYLVSHSPSGPGLLLVMKAASPCFISRSITAVMAAILTYTDWFRSQL